MGHPLAAQAMTCSFNFIVTAIMTCLDDGLCIRCYVKLLKCRGHGFLCWTTACALGVAAIKASTASTWHGTLKHGLSCAQSCNCDEHGALSIVRAFGYARLAFSGLGLGSAEQ